MVGQLRRRDSPLIKNTLHFEPIADEYTRGIYRRSGGLNCHIAETACAIA